MFLSPRKFWHLPRSLGDYYTFIAPLKDAAMVSGTPVQQTGQPKLGDLLARFLEKHADAMNAGLAGFDVTAEVTPYDAGPVQPIYPKPAWEEAVAVYNYYRDGEGKSLPAPPQWPTLVAAHEPAVALAFCSGNFPQLVRNFHLIAQQANLGALRPQAGRQIDAPALCEWADKIQAKGQFPEVIQAVGALRLAKQFAEADKVIQAFDGKVPAPWQAAWYNEKAALLWQQGKAEQARNLWQAMPASIPVLFNRGMAELFLGNKDKARASLKDAVAQLPESSAWHHLGRLYLTLASR